MADLLAIFLLGLGIFLVALAVWLSGCVTPVGTIPPVTPTPIAEDNTSYTPAVGYDMIGNHDNTTVTGFIDTHGEIHYA